MSKPSVYDWHLDNFGDIMGDKKTYPSKKLSHGHRPTRILEGDHNGGWSLYIGSRYDVKDTADKYGTIVNLTGDSIFSAYEYHIIPKSYPRLLKYNEAPPVQSPGAEREIILNWPNYGVPHLQFQFWVDLFSQISLGGKTLLFCMGGHGRTGTATCLLMLASGVQTEGDSAILWLRKHYCEKAVEGTQQREMINRFAKWLKKGASDNGSQSK